MLSLDNKYRNYLKKRSLEYEKLLQNLFSDCIKSDYIDYLKERSLAYEKLLQESNEVDAKYLQERSMEYEKLLQGTVDKDYMGYFQNRSLAYEEILKLQYAGCELNQLSFENLIKPEEYNAWPDTIDGYDEEDLFNSNNPVIDKEFWTVPEEEIDFGDYF